MEEPAVLLEPHKTAIFAERMGLPEVPLVGSVEYTQSGDSLPPHVHEGCLELVCLYKGRQIYDMDDTEYKLSGGMVFAAPPGRKHGTGGYPEDKAVFQWVQVDLSRPGKLFSLPPEESRVLCGQLSLLPPVFNGCASLKRHLNAFLAAACSCDLLRATKMRTEMLAFLLDILACAQGTSRRCGMTEDIGQCVAQIEAEFAGPIDWQAMARTIHLSDSRFRQKFREQLGLPPQEYLWRRRIDEAKAQIPAGGVSLSKLAEELGFDSPSYFTRVFRRYTGLTPTQFREGRPPTAAKQPEDA